MVYYNEDGYTGFKSCQNGKHKRRENGVGEFLDGKYVACGGRGLTELTDCVVIDEFGSKTFDMTSNGRTYASYVKLDNSTIWITGGQDSMYQALSSTEFVTVNGSKAGPNLPFAIQEHCMVQYKEDAILLIGGSRYYSPSKETWIIDLASLITFSVYGKPNLLKFKR